MIFGRSHHAQQSEDVFKLLTQQLKHVYCKIDFVYCKIRSNASRLLEIIIYLTKFKINYNSNNYLSYEIREHALNMSQSYTCFSSGDGQLNPLCLLIIYYLLIPKKTSD